MQETTEIFRPDLIFFDDGLPDTTCTPMAELARAYRRIFSQKARWQIMNLSSEFGDDKVQEYNIEHAQSEQRYENFFS